MEDLLKLARRPAVTIAPSATVSDLAQMLMLEAVGAAIVVDCGALVGIASERDVVASVAQGLNPEFTMVCEIMTRNVRTTRDVRTADEVADLMFTERVRHLPVVDEAGRVEGMLSVRHLLRRRLARLDLENADLLGFIAADGPGG